MTDENPFEDVKRAVEALLEKQLELLKQIDQLDVDVTSWEADFLDDTMKQLMNEKKPLTQGQLDVVHQLCTRYEIDMDL